MRRTLRSVLVAAFVPTAFASLAVIAVAAAHDVARADALPAPEDCPSGQVWVDGHSGGGCRPVAPKDCAPGWRGQIGGRCNVAQQIPDTACEDGLVAKDAQLCIEKMEDHGNGRVRFDPPREFDFPMGIMGPGLECKGDKRRVEAGKVCIASGETPTPFVMDSLGTDGPRRPKARSNCSAGGDDAPIGFALALMALVAARHVARRQPRRGVQSR